jgi:hypothetical protein
MARFHGLFPGATADILGLVNRVLPRATNSGKKKGSETALSRSRMLGAMTILGRAAARRFLQPQAAGGSEVPGGVPVGGR